MFKSLITTVVKDVAVFVTINTVGGVITEYTVPAAIKAAKFLVDAARNTTISDKYLTTNLFY
jgi:hypothetical protein